MWTPVAGYIRGQLKVSHDDGFWHVVPICPCVSPASGSAVHVILGIISSTLVYTFMTGFPLIRYKHRRTGCIWKGKEDLYLLAVSSTETATEFM